MTIERSRVRAVAKPWGSKDLHPWGQLHEDGTAIGELWFLRADDAVPAPALLPKLLFTKQPLSIQVHPDDAYARSIGLANGKTEAWYILSATPDSRIALGLTTRLTPSDLRRAIESGAIADLVDWRAVQAGETILVPAGTIHALGAGLVVAEIQQNSDATFRMFDYGRDRPLDVESAVAVAVATPFTDHPAPQAQSAGRTLLTASPYFVLEQIDLPHGTDWHLHARSETWAILLNGCTRLGSIDVSAGEAIFLDRADTDLKVGPDGLRGLLAYVATEPIPDLLRPQFDLD